MNLKSVSRIRIVPGILNVTVPRVRPRLYGAKILPHNGILRNPDRTRTRTRTRTGRKPGLDKNRTRQSDLPLEKAGLAFKNLHSKLDSLKTSY